MYKKCTPSSGRRPHQRDVLSAGCWLHFAVCSVQTTAAGTQGRAVGRARSVARPASARVCRCRKEMGKSPAQTAPSACTLALGPLWFLMVLFFPLFHLNSAYFIVFPLLRQLMSLSTTKRHWNNLSEIIVKFVVSDK